MPSVVLDTSALLAHIQEETGRERVHAAIRDGSFVSTVTLSETVAVLIERGFGRDTIEDKINPLPIEIVDFTDRTAWAAGLLQAITSRRNISFADRACLALGAELGLPVLTGDRAWAELPLSGNPQVILFR